MIKAKFYMTPDGAYESYKIEGHAEFDVPGKDLVCAGVSAAAYGVANSILSLTECKPNFSIEDGFMHVTDICDTEDVQLLVQSLEITLISLESEYNQFIRVIKKQ